MGRGRVQDAKEWSIGLLQAANRRWEERCIRATPQLSTLNRVRCQPSLEHAPLCRHPSPPKRSYPRLLLNPHSTNVRCPKTDLPSCDILALLSPNTQQSPDSCCGPAGSPVSFVVRRLVLPSTSRLPAALTAPRAAAPAASCMKRECCRASTGFFPISLCYRQGLLLQSCGSTLDSLQPGKPIYRPLSLFFHPPSSLPIFDPPSVSS